jgi:hypothetical protein
MLWGFINGTEHFVKMWWCFRLSKQFLPFMEPECLLSSSQNPSTESYLYSDESSRRSYTLLFSTILILYSHLHLNFPSHLFLSVIRNEAHYMLFTCYFHVNLICCTYHHSGFDLSYIVRQRIHNTQPLILQYFIVSCHIFWASVF